MRRRSGRPGILGTVARTAIISKTATTVSMNTQERKAAEQAARQAAAQPVGAPPEAAPVAAAAPAAAAAAPALGATERIAALQALAELKTSGILTDAEFEAEKAKILA